MRRIILMCPGIGHVRRGMEQSVAGIYDELDGSLDAEWHLWGGAGTDAGRRRALPIIARERLPRWITRLRSLGAVEIEQLSFFFAALPSITREAPAVIYCRDELLMRALAAAKRLFPGTRLVYGNGAPMRPPFPKGIDLMQHLTRHAYQGALAANEPPAKQRLVPTAFPIPATFTPPDDEERAALRRDLGLPPGAKILLCVSALNRYHKRVDYLVRETAHAPDRDIVLVLLGEREPESPSLLAEARALLGERVVAPPPADEISRWYRAADLFALPSAFEGFGRVIIEALAAGLPLVLHDGPSFREVAGPHARFVDMHAPGALAAALASSDPWRRDPAAAAARHRWAFERHSWHVLRERHLELFSAALGG